MPADKSNPRRLNRTPLWTISSLKRCSNEKRVEEVGAPLLAQDLQDFRGAGELGVERQPPVDGLLVAPLLEQQPVEALDAKQRRPEGERVDEPEFACDHRSHKARLGSK